MIPYSPTPDEKALLGMIKQSFKEAKKAKKRIIKDFWSKGVIYFDDVGMIRSDEPRRLLM